MIRRHFLYGLGSIISLPYFESLSYSQDITLSPKRAIFIFSPNGMNMNDWNLQKDCKNLDNLSSTLKPLDPFKKQLKVFSGLAQVNARPNGDGAGDHARSMSTFLTGVQIKKTGGANITAGISIDQIAANHLKKHTRIPSLQVGCESSKTAGSCDSGYSCAYSSTISWAGPYNPLPKDINPASIFSTIYGNGSKTTLRHLETKKSILDYSLQQASTLRLKLNDYDKRKLDDYLNSIREIERRIQLEKLIPKENPNQREIFSSIPKSFDTHAKTIIDLIILSLLTDSTRIVTLALTNEGSNRPYPEIDVSDGHHDLSHHQNDQSKLDKLSQINKLHITQVAYLLEQLKLNNLIDSTIVSYGCGIEDGNTHAHHDLPILICGGDIQGDKHIILPSETPLNNLWLGILQHLDITQPNEKFGNSTNILHI
jgi:hypothetical protein